jgi:hypothetical protein
VQLATSAGFRGRAIFDLSAPAGGQPGETLVAWVLTLPQGQTFARHDRFEVVSQSREDLIQHVHFYPDVETQPLMRKIAYDPGADNNADNPSIGTTADSPCTAATAECLMVTFRLPGLAAHDSISFSAGILSGGAPITNDDLCKAKITYVFSDGYATTSNFGRCPPATLPLIASSWRPDLHVPPHRIKTDKLLAQGGGIVLAAAPASAQKPLPGGDPGNNNPPPSGAILDLNGTPIPGGGNSTYQMYTVNFTASLASTAITFAFRDDPAFISFSNPSVTDLTVPGSNLLTNSTFSGATGTSTPVGWTYANTYGATYGGVVTASCGVGGGNCWYDGAVQAYDAISQTITTTPEHLYQISFWVAENSGCSTDTEYGLPCNFSDLSTNGDTTDTGGNGIDVTVYAQAGLPPAASTGPWTPNPNNPSQPLYIPIQTGLSDADPHEEGGQPGQSCNNGKTHGTNNVTGTIIGNVTVSTGQQCNYTSCEFVGNLTIAGGSVYLGCPFTGNITENGGILILASSASVEGNVTISGASAFTIQPGVRMVGNLQIQNLAQGVPQSGTVCGIHLTTGNLIVQGNASPIEIGSTQGCAGNTVTTGSIQVNNNTALTDVYSNTVTNGSLACLGNSDLMSGGNIVVNGSITGCAGQ